jgi:hypothetical protein
MAAAGSTEDGGLDFPHAAIGFMLIGNAPSSVHRLHDADPIGFWKNLYILLYTGEFKASPEFTRSGEAP